ncbi:MAG: hypothetical protein JST91_07980 [Actinobacteria bacterium]|nr:hypothetical protein [Actinomycetota bacterium]
MNRTLLARTWLIATALAAIGLVAGGLAGTALAGREPQRYTAEATLAMLPSQQVPVTQAPGFWEVLSRGQATRSAAIMLADGKWLGDAAAAAGVPESQLSLQAGAIADTTLIDVMMRADTAQAAEAALDKVLADAVIPAATAAGPFRLEVVSAPGGSAKTTGPAKIQVVGALAIAGLLVGGGLGLLVSRSVQKNLNRQAAAAPGRRHTPTSVAATNGRPVTLGEPENSAVSTPSR